MAEQKTLREYLTFIFVAPLATWWGALTFLLEAIAFFFLAESMTFNRVTLLIILFVTSFSLFVGLATVYRGWLLFVRPGDTVLVTQVTRVEEDQFFLLISERRYDAGTILELHRRTENLEIPIGILEVINQRQDGILQAKPLWILPGHKLEIEGNQLSIDNLIVRSSFGRNLLVRWVDSEAEKRVRTLLRRGQP